MNVWPSKSGESFGDGTTGCPSDLRNVFASEGVLVLELHFVDLVGTDVLALESVHEVDLH